MGGLIKQANELVIPQIVKMMIYGQPGMGKTTVALSAPKPLLLDFDNGVKRVNMNHLEGIDIVQVSEIGGWSGIQTLINTDYADLAPYQTIVVDTIGKMMDFIITHCCGTRQPLIKEWGRINQTFTGSSVRCQHLTSTSYSWRTVTAGKRVILLYLFRLSVRSLITLSSQSLTCSAILK